jgi:hypothetical protein
VNDVADIPTRAQIVAFEQELRKVPQLDIESMTQHTFGPGVYVRTMTIPAGVCVTGKVHAKEHVFIVSKGDITIVTAGEGRIRVRAPFQTIGKPGAKRAVYAHEDTVCTNVHITDVTDLQRLEAELIVPEGIGFDSQERLA